MDFKNCNGSHNHDEFSFYYINTCDRMALI